MRGRMKRFRIRPFPYHRGLRIAFGVAAVGTALLLAACSSGSSASHSNSAASTADVSALTHDVNHGAAVPNFSTYAAGYGSKLPSIANLSGKKIMILPGDSALAACT